MNRADIEQVVKESLANVAPEADIGNIDADKSFRDQFDFDSMDYLTLMTELNRKLDIRIAEIDYPKLSSLSGCVDYLERKLQQKAETG